MKGFRHEPYSKVEVFISVLIHSGWVFSFFFRDRYLSSSETWLLTIAATGTRIKSSQLATWVWYRGYLRVCVAL